ncbi:hypothetical protein ACXGQW_02405 [Wenyingzhuangia sp. IMCC45533]
MKNLILGMFAFAGIATYAQADQIIVTKVDKEVKEMENGNLYTTEVKVITEKTKAVKMDPNQKYSLNQDRLSTPTQVEKTIMVDNDDDPQYDKIVKVKYSVHNDKKYNFAISGNQLLSDSEMSSMDNDEKEAINKMYHKHHSNKADSKKNIYFNENDHFVVKYHDKVQDDVEYAVFETTQL